MLSELSCAQINLLIRKICLQLIPLPPSDKPHIDNNRLNNNKQCSGISGAQ